MTIPEMIERGLAGDAQAISELFDLHRAQLRRMIGARLDQRLQGRLDPSDVLQESFIDFAQALPSYAQNPDAPFHLWLRCIVGRKLRALHRQHLGTEKRDAKRDVSIYQDAVPEANSASLAGQLLGKLTTPSQALQRAEIQLHIQNAICDLDPEDREIISLRHYEQLNNRDTAAVLGMSEAAASIRFIRALRRLKDRLKGIPGLLTDIEWTAPAEKTSGPG